MLDRMFDLVGGVSRILKLLQAKNLESLWESWAA